MALLSFDSPCEIAGVLEAPEGKPVPFILVRTKTSDSREKYLLKSGEGVSWEKYCLTMCDVEGDMSLAGEGRIKHFKLEKKIIIYSSPGPSHKLSFSILKTKFPDYSSILWRDG